jgi:hypothetical protein
MTHDSSRYDQNAPTRARIETWGTAFTEDSGAIFSEMAAPDVALEGSIFPETINGRENVFRALRLSASLYDRLNFVHQAVLPDRTYMEWAATAFGLAISGVTVLTIDSDGWLVRIALHHRPLGVVQRFSAEFSDRLRRA